MNSNDRPTAFGLALDAAPLDNWTPLEALVVVKCLDEDGTVSLVSATTPSLNTWEAAGMVRWAQLTLEDEMTEDSQDNGGNG